MKNKKTCKFIIALLFLLVAYFIFKVCLQEAVIWNSGSGDNNDKWGFSIHGRVKEPLKIGAMGGAAALMIKACPPQTRPGVALGFGVIGSGYILASECFSRMSSSNSSGGSGVSTNVGKSNVSVTWGESSDRGVSKLVWDSWSNICTIIKERLMGSPIYCEGSSWNPMNNINEALMGFSDEEKFFIGIILLLLGALYTSIGIMSSILTRFIFSKPLKNKYLEIIRIRWSQSNNVILIVLFIMQLFSIIYSIYALSAYVELIHIR